ncbi:MAG: D-glycero-alpha-D-manno-heptose-1,7-bisphosphate 7-phosphatase [Runella sp.]
MKRKCVFLDRDGVLNQDLEGYLFKAEEMVIPQGVIEGLKKIKEAGYLLIVITNQAGIAKGLYTREDVWKCHEYFQAQCGGLLDDLYFCAHHPDYDSASLLRKPDSLMLEKAMAKHNIDATTSWMVGDRLRDIQAGSRAGVRTILLNNKIDCPKYIEQATDFEEVTKKILQKD